MEARGRDVKIRGQYNDFVLLVGRTYLANYLDILCGDVKLISVSILHVSILFLNICIEIMFTRRIIGKVCYDFNVQDKRATLT